MIKIIPAILVKTNEEFSVQIRKLATFQTIDIDICTPPFTEEKSVDTQSVLNLLKGFDGNICIHLMEENFLNSIELITSSDLKIEKLYIHQESNLNLLKTIPDNIKRQLGITVKRESKIKEYDFYKQFSSVQLMTGIFGSQGKVFDEESLAKSIELREMGYEGEIGIDGGVNLNTAIIIKNYPIDRVSVGSFLQKSKNPILDGMKLDLALNMRNIEESF